MSENKNNKYISKTSYFKFIDSNDEDIADTYKSLYNLKNKITYPPSNSNEQIKFLMNEIYKRKDITHYNNFIKFLTHFMSFNSSFKLFKIIYNSPNISDIDILKYVDNLKKNNKKRDSTEFIYRKISKQQYGLSTINKIMKKMKLILPSDAKYLDIGCGDGGKTTMFASTIGIISNNIHGTDIETWGPYMKNKALPFDFKLILKNGKLDYHDESFDVITAFLTLHHIKNLDLILDEIYRILKKDGLFIIIEHDSLDFLDNLLIDIQHTFFAYFYDGNKNFIKNPVYIVYYNLMEWKYILTKKHKFKLLYSNTLYQTIQMHRRYDNQFYAIFKK